MHPNDSHRLPGHVFDAVFVKGDGFGAGLTRHTLAEINSGADYSHIRDSSPAAWRAMAVELRAHGYSRMPATTFVDHDGPTAVRAGLPMVERQAILAIVRHWRDDTVLGLRWKTVSWETLITGGIEAGQSAEAAALAEIAEETGYTSARLVKTLQPVEAKFYHEAKGENRHARFTVMALDLADGARAPVAASEAAMHEPVWLSRDEMALFRLPPAQRHAWTGYLSWNAAGRP